MSAMDQVYSELKHAVMAGDFSPGQPMRLELLASAFGTSHMPVREALNRLTVAGALERAPRKSLRIPRLSIERVRNLMHVRLVNEGQAVVWAAERCTEKDLVQLREFNVALDKVSSREEIDISHYLKANQAFHFHLYGIAGNDVLLNTIEMLWLQSGPLLNLLKSGPKLLSGHRYHNTIVTELGRGNGAGASAALERDIREAYDRILAIVSV